MPASSTPRALLVEDEPDHGLLLRILLQRDGLEVVEAPTLAEARAAARQLRPDVIVVDVPQEVSGAAARCRDLRSEPELADVPMVALSAAHDRAAREALLEAGVDGLLGKPVVPWLLEWQVRAALRRPAREGGRSEAELLAEHHAWMGYLVHDLNNPLTVLGGSLGLLGMDPLTQRQQRALQQARAAQERLTRLVQSLLDVERVTLGGRIRVDLQPASIPAVLEDVAFILTGLAAPRDVGIDVSHAGESLWPLDRSLVERALVNLGENALRHAPKGSVLALTAREEGQTLRLSVVDQGPGVPDALRARIFDRGVQLGDRRGQGAAGLGLAFCRLVAELHGGRAWVESGPTGGAAFVLALPWPG